MIALALKISMQWGVIVSAIVPYMNVFHLYFRPLTPNPLLSQQQKWRMCLFLFLAIVLGTNPAEHYPIPRGPSDVYLTLVRIKTIYLSKKLFVVHFQHEGYAE